MVSSINDGGENGQLCVKELTQNILYHYTQQIKGQNVRPDTIKPLEEHIGREFFDLNHSNIFFNPSPRVMEIQTTLSYPTLSQVALNLIFKNFYVEVTIGSQEGFKKRTQSLLSILVLVVTTCIKQYNFITMKLSMFNPLNLFRLHQTCTY